MGFFDFINKDIKITGGDEKRTYIPSMNNIVEEKNDSFSKNFVSIKEQPIPQTNSRVLSVAVQIGMSSPSLQNIMLYEPKDFNDVKTIIDYIRAKTIIAVNLNNVTDEVAQRILDFVSGASYAIGSTVSRHEKSIFVIAPFGYKVIPYKNER